jgi:predicted Zn-dependent protease
MSAFIRVQKILTTLFVVCFLVTSSATPSWSFFGSFPVEKEKEVGEEFNLAVQQYLSVVQDAYLNSYINAIGQKIVQHLGSQPFKYRFAILEDPSVNAFAVPGGYIYVHTGLIRLMEREDELAGVLAHEISHVHARHMAKNMEKSKLPTIASVIGALAAVLLGGPLAQPLLVAAMGGGEAMMLKYSREFEREADTLGFKWLTQCGYNPRDMMGVFNKMSRLRWFEGAEVPYYLKSHPDLESRIVDISHLMVSNHIVEKKYPTHPEFTYFKQRLEALYGNPGRMQRDLARKLRQEPNSAPLNYCMAIVHKRLGDRTQATDCYKAALAQDPKNLMIKKDLAIFYFEGNRKNEAETIFKEILAQSPRDEVALYYMGLINQDQRKLDEALALFEKVHSLNPAFTGVYYSLGTLYGEKQRLGLAHYYLGMHSRIVKDYPNTLFHFRKALNYLSSQDKFYREAQSEVARLEKMRVKVAP